jgi:hypothetical protein
MNIRKNILQLLPFLPGALIAVIAPMLAACFLWNLGPLMDSFIEFGEGSRFDFVQIFNQTRDAELTVHFGTPLLCGILFCIIRKLALVKINRKALRISLSAVLVTVLFVVATVFSLALTRVNGISFFSLLEKLLPLMDKL